jgi:hypothetical protein
MTKKHFQALAWELAACRPEEEGEALDAWERACAAVCAVAKEVNRAFDRERFLDACRGTATVSNGRRAMVDAVGRKFSA